jgi:hypothetical protein
VTSYLICPRHPGKAWFFKLLQRINQMSGILSKYTDLAVHIDQARANELNASIGRMSHQQLDGIYVGSEEAGRVILLDSPGEPNCVLELVMSASGDDSVSTLFKAHPVFNSRGDYLEARAELILALHDLAAGAGKIEAVLYCPVRKRPVRAKELGFQQMLDALRRIVLHATSGTKH